ncbi:MAG: mercury methylation corrinoid protein HgcA [Myxococcota bacterium]|nr:mercury methylation corrinoid protein HgcA [Myxococcota bacterium]
MKPDPLNIGELTIIGPETTHQDAVKQAPENAICCGGVLTQKVYPAADQTLPFVVGMIETPVGSIPRVASTLTRADRIGGFKARWGVGRMDYAIPPGLYGLGRPDADSAVLVTANYKLTFDKLRSALPGRNLWILVLDTLGINVWCAAGKGTFGTGTLVQQIAISRLAEVVRHRQVVVPQLGAPGVAGHEVRQQSGFKVIFGPIQAEDLLEFLDAGLKVTHIEMRRKAFPLAERAVLIPVELVSATKGIVLITIPLVLLSGLGGPGDFWHNVRQAGGLAALSLFAALISGAVLTPLLLPWLPGRAFSLKGLTIGAAMVSVILLLRGGDVANWQARFEAGAWLLLVPTISAFLGMNFTGASTYTSLSGVRREMRIAVPLQIIGASAGLLLWVASRLTA